MARKDRVYHLLQAAAPSEGEAGLAQLGLKVCHQVVVSRDLQHAGAQHTPRMFIAACKAVGDEARMALAL